MDLKGVADVLGAITDVRNRKQLIAAQKAVLDAQARELKLNDTIRKLKEEVADRDKQLSQRAATDTEMAQYEEHEIKGTWVITKTGKPNGPFYCPGCYSRGTPTMIVRLPPTFSVIGTHKCPSCETVFSLT